MEKMNETTNETRITDMIAPNSSISEEFATVRTMTINGELWFVGKDVAQKLGYHNTKKALGDHVDPEDKMRSDGVTILDRLGRKQTPVLINEAGFYSLIFSSKLPGAKKYKRWVVSEVLPSIRKNGGYMKFDQAEKVVNDTDALHEFINKLLSDYESQKNLAAENETVASRFLY